MRSLIRLTVAAIAISAGGAVSAQQITSLEPNACKGAPGNAAAQRHDHAAVIYDCAGAGGWRIKLTYFGTNVGADFTNAGTKAQPFTLRAPFNIGPRIEWHAAKKGAAPQAAIVRLHVRTDSQRTASALAVLGISGSRMCLAGIVDGRAADANGKAREFAKGVIANGCATNAQTIGDKSAVIEELLDLNK